MGEWTELFGRKKTGFQGQTPGPYNENVSHSCENWNGKGAKSELKPGNPKPTCADCIPGREIHTVSGQHCPVPSLSMSHSLTMDGSGPMLSMSVLWSFQYLLDFPTGKRLTH